MVHGYEIRWPDSHFDRAETLDQLYDHISKDYHPNLRFRFIMVSRAKKWSNTDISIFHTKAGFVKELARARMFRLREI